MLVVIVTDCVSSDWAVVNPTTIRSRPRRPSYIFELSYSSVYVHNRQDTHWPCYFTGHIYVFNHIRDIMWVFLSGYVQVLPLEI